ncbi:MAG TPA: hypothetical protein VFZ97_13295 [Acidimicrobiales bacterium]
MRRTLTILITSILPAASILCFGGCSSSAKESDKTAAQIFADAKTATSSLRSAHVVGRFSGVALQSIDVVVGQSVGGGSVAVGGQQISIFADQNSVYMKATPSAWLALSKDPKIGRLGGHWAIFPSGSAFYAQFGINSIQKLVDNTLNQDPKTLTKGPTTTVLGQKAIELHSPQGMIFVAAKGPPYLLGLQGGGAVAFTQFNTAAVPTAPQGAVPATDLLK